jgi:hypothetical protein
MPGVPASLIKAMCCPFVEEPNNFLKRLMLIVLMV